MAIYFPCFRYYHTSASSPLFYGVGKSQYRSSLKYSHLLAKNQDYSTFFKTRKTHQNQRAFLEKLKGQQDFDPVQMLKEDGDWSNEQLWVVVKFLKQTSRCNEFREVCLHFPLKLCIFIFCPDKDSLTYNITRV